jgi:pyruvate kinase
MQKGLMPSRADVCDVSNAVLSGIDCLVLTGETATGPHFAEASEYLSKICYEAERTVDYEKKFNLK